MRILVVTQYFWPENFRINDLCVELSSRGHEVAVLTGKPNYPDGNVFQDYLRNPDDFKDYQGCQVVRVPMISRGKGSSVKLLMNYLTYAFSASTWGIFKLRKRKFDVVFVCQLSPVTIALPAILYQKIYKKPVVIWVLDLWPETLEAIGVVKSPKVLSGVGRLVKFIYNRCDLILGQSKAFYDGIAKYCDNNNKIKYFPSWSEAVYDKSGFSPIEGMQGYNGFKVLFAGNVGEAQDFPAMLHAANLLKAQAVQVRLFVVGDGRHVDWVRNAIVEQGLDEYVHLLGRYPLDEMPSFYATADALLVTLKESKAFAMTIPGKVQSYMASGKPILTMLSGEGSRVVEEAQCGFVARSGDYQKLAENVINMAECSQEQLAEFGANAKAYANKEFDRDTLITQLEGWFEDVRIKGN